MPEEDQTHEGREADIAVAVGHAVLGAASLEKSLLGQAITAHHDANLPAAEVETLESESSGRLLRRLRKQGMDRALADRIDDLIKRRNQLIHGLFEDIDVARAMVRGDGFAELRDGIERLSVEYRTVSQELQATQATWIEGAYKMTLAELARAVLSIDPARLKDPMEREAFETMHAFVGLTDWPDGSVYGD